MHSMDIFGLIKPNLEKIRTKLSASMSVLFQSTDATSVKILLQTSVREDEKPYTLG